MARPQRVKVILTHRPNDGGELYQACVEIDSIYPEVAADECRKQAAAAMHDFVADLRAQYGETTPSDQT